MKKTAASRAAALLGSIKSPAKARASRENGSAPVKKGSKPRGWPKGKKRKPKTK